MKANKWKPEFCPICELQYQKDEPYMFIPHLRTKHHIFPKLWYKDGLKVYVCSDCHTYGFHIMFPMGNRIWLPSECVQYWVRFCKSKGKNAYHIYPELLSLQPLR